MSTYWYPKQGFTGSSDLSIYSTYIASSLFSSSIPSGVSVHYLPIGDISVHTEKRYNSNAHIEYMASFYVGNELRYTRVYSDVSGVTDLAAAIKYSLTWLSPFVLFD